MPWPPGDEPQKESPATGTGLKHPTDGSWQAAESLNAVTHSNTYNKGEVSEFQGVGGGNLSAGSCPASAAEVKHGAAISPIRFTIFPDEYARSYTEAEAPSIEAIAEMIRRETASCKEALPYFKAALVNGEPSPKGCARHDEAVVAITGVECDYDQPGTMPIEEAAKRLAEAGVEVLLHETTSSTPNNQRWRILAFTSQEYTGSTNELRALRARFVARINGVLGGVLAGESFVLSQAFHFGGVTGKTQIEVIVTAGTRIDLRDNLDAGAIFKNGRSTPTQPRVPSAARDRQGQPNEDNAGGVIESDDDPRLIRECRSRAANFMKKAATGNTPTAKGERARDLVQWLADIGTWDGLTPSAGMIATVIARDFPNTTIDDVRDLMTRRQSPRGCKVIDAEEPEEPPDEQEHGGDGESEPPPPDPPIQILSIAEATRILEEEVRLVISTWAPVKRLIRGAMGLGKTAMVLRLIAEYTELNPEIVGEQIVYVAQRHDLLEAAAKKLAECLRDRGWSEDAINENVIILRGRDHVGRDAAGNEKEPLCQRHREAALVAKHGGSPSQSLCRQPKTKTRPEIKCPFFDECPFQEMKRRSAYARFIFMTHAHLTSQWPPYGKPGTFHPYNAKLIIVDEDPTSALLDGKATKIKAGSFAELVPCFGATIEEALARPDALDFLREAGVTPEWLYYAEAQRRAKEKSPRIGHPGMTEEERKATAEKIAKAPAQVHLARWIACLADELKTGRSGECLSMRLEMKKEGAETSDILARGRRQIWKTGGQKWLILDGTSNVEELRCFLPEIEERRIDVARNVVIVQVYDHTYSKASTIQKDGQPTELLETASRLVELLARAHRVAVFATKSQRAAMTGEDTRPAFTPFRGARLGHYGNLRGSNEFEDCEIGVLIGRPERYLDLIENDARALNYDTPEPIQFVVPDAKGNRRLESKPARYTMRDGTRAGEGSRTTYHPDPRAQMRNEASREAEMLQAIDRLRLVHNPKPKLVFILSSLPLPIPVDVLISADDIAKVVEFADLLALAGAPSLGATAQQTVPLTGAYLHATWPERWPSPESGKYLLSEILPKEVNEFLKVSNDPLDLIRKIYRAGNSNDTLNFCLLRLALDQAGWDLAKFRSAGIRGGEWSAFAYRIGADPASGRLSLAVALGRAATALDLKHLDGSDFMPGSSGDALLDQAISICAAAGMALPLDPEPLAALPGSPWLNANAVKNWKRRAGVKALEGPPPGWVKVEYRNSRRHGSRPSTAWVPAAQAGEARAAIARALGMPEAEVMLRGSPEPAAAAADPSMPVQAEEPALASGSQRKPLATRELKGFRQRPAGPSSLRPLGLNPLQIETTQFAQDAR